MSLKFEIYFPKFHIKFYFSKLQIYFLKSPKAKEFVSIEKNLFLVTFATKSMHKLHPLYSPDSPVLKGGYNQAYWLLYFPYASPIG